MSFDNTNDLFMGSQSSTRSNDSRSSNNNLNDMMMNFSQTQNPNPPSHNDARVQQLALQLLAALSGNNNNNNNNSNNVTGPTNPSPPPVAPTSTPNALPPTPPVFNLGQQQQRRGFGRRGGGQPNNIYQQQGQVAPTFEAMAQLNAMQIENANLRLRALQAENEALRNQLEIRIPGVPAQAVQQAAVGGAGANYNNADDAQPQQAAGAVPKRGAKTKAPRTDCPELQGYMQHFRNNDEVDPVILKGLEPAMRCPGTYTDEEGVEHVCKNFRCLRQCQGYIPLPSLHADSSELAWAFMQILMNHYNAYNPNPALAGTVPCDKCDQPCDAKSLCFRTFKLADGSTSIIFGVRCYSQTCGDHFFKPKLDIPGDNSKVETARAAVLLALIAETASSDTYFKAPKSFGNKQLVNFRESVDNCLFLAQRFKHAENLSQVASAQFDTVIISGQVYYPGRPNQHPARADGQQIHVLSVCVMDPRNHKKIVDCFFKVIDAETAEEFISFVDPFLTRHARLVSDGHRANVSVGVKRLAIKRFVNHSAMQFVNQNGDTTNGVENRHKVLRSIAKVRKFRMVNRVYAMRAVAVIEWFMSHMTKKSSLQDRIADIFTLVLPFYKQQKSNEADIRFRANEQEQADFAREHAAEVNRLDDEIFTVYKRVMADAHAENRGRGRGRGGRGRGRGGRGRGNQNNDDDDDDSDDGLVFDGDDEETSSEDTNATSLDDFVASDSEDEEENEEESGLGLGLGLALA